MRNFFKVRTLQRNRIPWGVRKFRRCETEWEILSGAKESLFFSQLYQIFHCQARFQADSLFVCDAKNQWRFLFCSSQRFTKPEISRMMEKLSLSRRYCHTAVRRRCTPPPPIGNFDFSPFHAILSNWQFFPDKGPPPHSTEVSFLQIWNRHSMSITVCKGYG